MCKKLDVRHTHGELKAHLLPNKYYMYSESVGGNCSGIKTWFLYPESLHCGILRNNAASDNLEICQNKIDSFVEIKWDEKIIVIRTATETRLLKKSSVVLICEQSDSNQFDSILRNNKLVFVN